MFNSYLRPNHTEALSSPDAVPGRLPARERQCQPDKNKCGSPGFALEKFYLDAVTDAGDYFIGYAADLFFKRLSLGYADTVHSPELYGLRSGPRMGRGREPLWQNGALIWRHPGLGFEGSWLPLAPPRRVELLSTPKGHVDWHCLQPAAKVSLKTASGLAIEALGYCEHLTLTIPPWQLGLAELIWGRFVSVSQSVVWIVWRGKHAMRLVLWNDNSTDCADISEGHVNTEDFGLAIEPVRTLRQGYLGQNLLSKVPAAYHLAPAALLQVRESKKLGRGILRMRDGRQHEGWVIHEKVTWPH
jgi:hypothetical protein